LAPFSSSFLCPSPQVVIGGKNKYLINGHNAQKGRVENFFHSVQLNVNNPHFLIMQGRITKVLNMKPREVSPPPTSQTQPRPQAQAIPCGYQRCPIPTPLREIIEPLVRTASTDGLSPLQIHPLSCHAQILSMIEEAAGTRMYETKKAASLQTMERKEQKMAEIERMLAEEIQPTLEKLRNERSAFFEWQKNKMEIDRLNRLVVAYQFTQMEQLLIRSKNEMVP